MAASHARPIPPARPTRLAGGDRYRELVERVSEAVAPRLDVGLLARPAREEALDLARLGQGRERLPLRRREEALGDPLRPRHRPELLDVDADLTAAGDGEKGDVARMGDVEAQVRGLRRRERGLAPLPVGEAQAVG